MEVSRLLWGLAVLDHLPKTAADSLYKKLATLHLASLTAESLDQILQVSCCAAPRYACCAVLCCACCIRLCRAVLCCAVLYRAMPVCLCCVLLTQSNLSVCMLLSCNCYILRHGSTSVNQCGI